MLHAFKPAPTPTLTQKENSRLTHELDKHRVWFFLFKPTAKKKKKKESYSSQKNSVWGSSTLRQQKALLFAK